METVAHLKRRFSAMPWLLRMFVVASMAIGCVFSVLPLLPGASFGLGERELSFSELWQTRVAFALFAVGPLMLGLGVAVLLRKAWARPLLVVLPLLQVLPFLVTHWVFAAPSPVSSLAGFAGLCALWAVLAIAYLFGSRQAIEHFANAV